MYTSPIYDDPKYRCWCNVHVERAARIIAIVGSVLAAIGFIFALLAAKWSYGVGEMVHFLLYLSILYAQKKREPVLYLPYVILAGIGLVAMVLTTGFIAVMFFVRPDFYFDPARQVLRESGYQGDPDRVIAIFLAVELAILVVYLAVSTFFYSLIFRAWRYMRDEKDVHVPPPTAVYTNTAMPRV